MKKILAILIVFLLATIGTATNEPTSLQATDITDKEITISFIPNPTWYNTSVYIDSVFQTNYTVNNTLQTHTFTGLIKSTNYSIAIRSYNTTSEYSNYVNISVVTLNMPAGTMKVIWDLVNNMVENTGSIIGLILIGVIIGVMIVIKTFISKTLDKSIQK
ncbi:MAG: fibronectin type III domain-containing protein [Solirubrobacteraceae bacterium]|nr:fibronectin type III domain-containing protein [Solirubrobacteraceae bacterium]